MAWQNIVIVIRCNCTLTRQYLRVRNLVTT